MTGKFFPNNISTIGVVNKKINITIDIEDSNKSKIEKKFEINLVDTTGQENFRAITFNYYRGSDGILLMYDITDKTSFDHVSMWVNSINETIDNNQGTKYSIILIGNKLDLVSDDDPKKQRQVSEDEAINACEKYNMIWGNEISTKDITKKDLKSNLVNLCASVSQTCSVKFRLSMPDDTDTSFLDENDILNIYRIAQESFTNIIKHSKAEEAVILIRNASENEEKGLYIFISDDGCGFDYDAEHYGNSGFTRLGASKHFGLMGMEKRAQLIGADFSVSSAVGEGTQIRIFKKDK